MKKIYKHVTTRNVKFILFRNYRKSIQKKKEKKKTNCGEHSRYIIQYFKFLI
jgi:hypothetical protein